MKSYTQLAESLVYKKPKWVRPDPAALHQEYHVEYKSHPKQFNPSWFPTEESFMKAVGSAQSVSVSRSVDNKIAYRSRCKNMAQLLSLIKTYRSYPKFRNKESLEKLEKLIVGGGAVTMPIVVQTDDGLMVMGGNTRMDIAFMHGIDPTVIVVKVDSK